jgi:hypothetical protein
VLPFEHGTGFAGARRRWTAALLVAGTALAVGVSRAGAAVQIASVGTFSAPVYVTSPPGDIHRAFVVQRSGSIKIIKDGVSLPTSFLDISPIVETGYQEQGLLGLAFAPDYATSGRFYVYFTTKAQSTPVVTGDDDIEIDEYQRSAANPDVADPATRRPVLVVPHPGKNFHNGGTIAFGPDGYLYVGTGDGGTNGAASRDKSSLLGKILRIDPRPGAALTPPGNPFGNPVWSIGLRNPYRWFFDQATGDMVIGEVGENTAEEIDFAPAATGLGRSADYGWSLLEGIYAYPPPSPLVPAPPSLFPPNYVGPVIQKLHSAGWCAIVGGPVARDPLLPDLLGREVYGDFCNGQIWSAVVGPGGAGGDARVALTPSMTIASLSGFGEDGCGRVYVTSLTGPVYRLGSGACVGPARTFPGPPGSGTPGGGGTGGPGTTPVVAQSPKLARAPALRLRAASRQRVLKRGYLTVVARCDQQCSVTAQAALRLRRHGPRAAAVRQTRAVKRTLAENARVVLDVPISPAARRAIRGVLAAHGVATATVTVSARGGTGIRRIAKVAARIVG